MPRKARVVVPNTPHHIVQRGHNKQVVFVERRDYNYYLQNLREWKEKLGCKLYAYCLMTNHIHLIVDPGENPDNLALLMKRVTARQTRLVNYLEKRTGSLWEGRFKSSPIDTNEYLLTCCRYVEMNPVRARMVELPEHYEWSSYRIKVGMVKNDWLDQDPVYLGLGETVDKRQAHYAEWVHIDIPDYEVNLIRNALQRGQLTGNSRFVEEIERKTGHRVELRGRGRPSRNERKGCR